MMAAKCEDFFCEATEDGMPEEAGGGELAVGAVVEVESSSSSTPITLIRAARAMV
jgi:hypothetical protein